MKSQLRKTVLAAMLLAPAAFLAVPLAANAQVNVNRTPEVRGLQMSADNGFAPGSQLNFTVEGTPRGAAQVRVSDAGPLVTLSETSPGTYEGNYTVRRGDRIDASGLLRVSLTRGSVTNAANYTFPPSFVAWQNNSAPTLPPVAAVLPRIDRFTASPDGRVEPGAQIRFALNGAPGGQATLNIPGVARNIEMTEVRPGVYNTSYTLRRQDNLDAFTAAAATLRVGNQLVTSNLTQPVALAPVVLAPVPLPMPPRVVVAPAPGPLPLDISSHRGSGGQWTQLIGLTAPNATLRVRIDAIPPVGDNRVTIAQQVAGDTIRADQYGNFTYNFNPRYTPAPGTRYEISITADNGFTTNEQKLTINGS